MKSLIITIITTLIATSASADSFFNGKWQAKEKGKMDLTQNNQYQGSVPCHDIYFTINDSQNILSIEDGYIYCGYAYELTLWTYDFTIEGDKIISQGKQIGTYSPQHIWIRQEDERSYIEIDIVKSTGGVDFYLTTFDGLTLVNIKSPVTKK